MTHSTLRLLHASLAALLTISLLPGAAQAQEMPSPAHVITVDTLGLASGRIAADAEFCYPDEPGGWFQIGCALTASLSLSADTRSPRPDSTHAWHRGDMEGVLRLRPDQLQGFFIGIRGGLTFVDDFEAAPNLGFEMGSSSVIAEHLYLGASVGAKKVFLLNNGPRLELGPVVRISAGIAF